MKDSFHISGGPLRFSSDFFFFHPIPRCSDKKCAFCVKNTQNIWQIERKVLLLRKIYTDMLNKKNRGHGKELQLAHGGSFQVDEGGQ